MSELEETFAKEMELLRKLPPPPPLGKHIPWEDMQHTRCHCGHLVPKNTLRTYWTGYIYALDNACECCKKDLDQMTKIVCAGCKGRVVARITPHTDKDGFEFKAGDTLHVKSCRFCDTVIKESTIGEKLYYLTHNKDRLKKQVDMGKYRL